MMSDSDDKLEQMQYSPTLFTEEYHEAIASAAEQGLLALKEPIEQLGLAMEQIAYALTPILSRFSRDISRIHYRFKPLWDRMRREEKRQARIERAELKAARKARRRKPALWAGETLREYRYEQMLHWKPHHPFRMAMGSFRFSERTTPEQMMAAMGIIDDPVTDD